MSRRFARRCASNGASVGSEAPLLASPPLPSRRDTIASAVRSTEHEGAPRCPACAALLAGGPALGGIDRLHGTPGKFEVIVCANCGSGLTLPVADEQALGAFYPSDYNAYGLPANPVLRRAATALFRWRYWRGLRRPPLAALGRRPPGRLLDVGGGRGDLGVTLRPSGWHVTSLDPSENACDEARRRGVDSECGTLTHLPAHVAGPYDAVVFQHSLEHVVDPATDLSVARSLLSDGGLVLITLPNFGSWQRRRFGGTWFHLDLPRHRVHFTGRGLETLLRRCGFRDVALSTSTSSDGLPMSVQYRLRGGRARGPARYAVTAVSLLAAPATRALNAVSGEGDILHAVAVAGSPD
jgi:SAM-dependent methyltransferase